MHRTHQRVTITKNGPPYLILMSGVDLESLKASLELLSDAGTFRRDEQANDDLTLGAARRPKRWQTLWRPAASAAVAEAERRDVKSL